ncbi:MAG: hypothetical protein WCR49_15115 [Opitutae bacterium]
MKDDRFIELINLYIDRQITTAETEELEVEIQGNPRRRVIYRQYCQMHRATTLVHESFRAHASAQPDGPGATPDTVAQFEGGRRNRRVRWTYYAGGLAAAACLGLIFGRLNSKPAAEINLLSMAAAPSLPPITAVHAPQATSSKAQAASIAVSPAGLVSLRNSATDYSAYPGVLISQQPYETHAFALGQARSNGLPSLFEDGVFDSQQVMPVPNQRVFRSKQTPAQQAEFTAFQFQR